MWRNESDLDILVFWSWPMSLMKYFLRDTLRIYNILFSTKEFCCVLHNAEWVWIRTLLITSNYSVEKHLSFYAAVWFNGWIKHDYVSVFCNRRHNCKEVEPLFWPEVSYVFSASKCHFDLTCVCAFDSATLNVTYVFVTVLKVNSLIRFVYNLCLWRHALLFWAPVLRISRITFILTNCQFQPMKRLCSIILGGTSYSCRHKPTSKQGHSGLFCSSIIPELKKVFRKKFF